MRRLARPLKAVRATATPLLPLPPLPRPTVHVSLLRHLSTTSSAANGGGKAPAPKHNHEELPQLRDEDIVRLAKEPQHQLRLADLVR